MTENKTEIHDEAAEDLPETEALAPEADGEGKPAEQLEAELDDLRDRLLRAVADAQNTRKRAEREVKDARDYAVSRFAGDLLAVADSLSRALQAVEGAELDGQAKALSDGVALTERALLAAFERHGVRRIAPSPGDSFDPHLHQAAAQFPSDQPAGAIAAVMADGYVLAGRTLRAAMVAVSAGPAEAASPGGNGVDIQA